MSEDVLWIHCKGKLYTGRTLCRTERKMQHFYSKMSLDAFRCCTPISHGVPGFTPLSSNLHAIP